MRELVTRLSEGAGAILLRRFGTTLRRTEKPAAGFVTEADLEAERFILDELARACPGAHVIAEESGETPGASPWTFYVDPLDGTTNYAHGLPWFAVSVAAAEAGVLRHAAILNPATGELCRAERGRGATLRTPTQAEVPLRVRDDAPLDEAVLGTGDDYARDHAFDQTLFVLANVYRRCRAVRVMGSVALALRDVAAGRLDGFWQASVNPWDVAAGQLAVEEAGGLVRTCRGEPFTLARPSGLVAGRAAVVEAIVRELTQHGEG